MLSHPIFTHHLTRKYVVAFGSLFTDLWIERRVKTTQELQKNILVPLSYAPKQKWLVKIKQDPTLTKNRVAMIMPRMCFQLTSMTYDPDRKLQSTIRNIKTASATEKAYQYVPVPYDFNFSLYILADNMEDGVQIVEQIYPFFRPELTLTIDLINELGISPDIPVVLNATNIEDNFDTDFDDKRQIIWTLDFVMRGYVYGPVMEQGIIRRVIVDTHAVGGGSGEGITDEQIAHTPRHVRVTVDPDPIDANPDDEFGFKETIEEFNDNKHRDPVSGEDVEIT